MKEKDERGDYSSKNSFLMYTIDTNGKIIKGVPKFKSSGFPIRCMVADTRILPSTFNFFR